jgi:hypothetical protein
LEEGPDVEDTKKRSNQPLNVMVAFLEELR